MRKIFTRSIPNQEAMRQLAGDLCANFFPQNEPFTLFLEGGLGAGKTFMAKEILSTGVKPEIEVFDLGHISLAKQLISEGLIDSPSLFHLCMGIPFGA
jgi:hypothetical protein